MVAMAEGIVTALETIVAIAEGRAPGLLKRSKPVVSIATVKTWSECHVSYAMNQCHIASQNSTFPQRTFASLDALGPCMIKFAVAGISALLEPSAAANTTATFASLFGSATLWA